MTKILIEYKVPDGEKCKNCAFLVKEVSGYGDMEGLLLIDNCSIFNKIIFGNHKCADCENACKSYPNIIKKQKRLRELP